MGALTICLPNVWEKELEDMGRFVLRMRAMSSSERMGGSSSHVCSHDQGRTMKQKGSKVKPGTEVHVGQGSAPRAHQVTEKHRYRQGAKSGLKA